MESPARDERPHGLEQQESPLLLHVRQHGEHRGADEVQHEEEVRALAEDTELRESEGDENGERA